MAGEVGSSAKQSSIAGSDVDGFSLFLGQFSPVFHHRNQMKSCHKLGFDSLLKLAKSGDLSLDQPHAVQVNNKRATTSWQMVDQ